MFLTLLSYLFLSSSFAKPMAEDINIIGLDPSQVGGFLLFKINPEGKVKLRMQGAEDCRPKACEGKVGSFSAKERSFIVLNVNCPAGVRKSKEARNLKIQLAIDFNDLKKLQMLDDSKDPQAFLQGLQNGQMILSQIRMSFPPNPKEEKFENGFLLSQIPTFGLRFPGFMENMPEECRWVD